MLHGFVSTWCMQGCPLPLAFDSTTRVRFLTASGPQPLHGVHGDQFDIMQSLSVSVFVGPQVAFNSFELSLSNIEQTLINVTYFKIILLNHLLHGILHLFLLKSFDGQTLPPFIGCT